MVEKIKTFSKFVLSSPKLRMKKSLFCDLATFMIKMSCNSKNIILLPPEEKILKFLKKYKK